MRFNLSKFDLSDVQIGDALYIGTLRHVVQGIEHLEKCTRINTILRTSRYVQTYHWNQTDLEYRVTKLIPVDKVRTFKPRKRTTVLMPYVFSANPAEFSKENRDCAVHAVSHVFGVDYAIAHAELKRLGREDNQGTFFYQVFPFIQLNGKRLVNMLAKQWYGHRKTVKQTIESGLPDRCIVTIRNHVFAVVNGKIYDSSRLHPKAKVETIWVVTEDETKCF